MVKRKKKKYKKFRGKRTYGYGSHKKHRGGGSRGGRGNAGLRKHKWSYTVKYKKGHFGKKGFKPPAATTKDLKTVNLRRLEQLAEGKKKIDVREFGYDKVLGSGQINTAMEVIAKEFSKRAVEKIEEAGGEARIIEKKEKVPEDKETEEETKED